MEELPRKRKHLKKLREEGKWDLQTDISNNGDKNEYGSSP